MAYGEGDAEGGDVPMKSDAAADVARAARVAREPVRMARTLRPWLLALIGCDLALLVVRAARSPAFFSMPGALGYLLEPVVALAVYTAVVVALPLIVARTPDMQAVLPVSIIMGVIGGMIEVASTALESLATLPQPVVSITTGVAMLSLFMLFGVAGFLGARHTRSFWLGIGAAVGCAIVAILIVVTFGFLLVNIALPALAYGEVHDPDFLRSGWTDVRAFAIANTCDAAFTHLVEAPVIAAVLGGVGAGIGLLGGWRRFNRVIAG